MNVDLLLNFLFCWCLSAPVGVKCANWADCGSHWQAWSGSGREHWVRQCEELEQVFLLFGDAGLWLVSEIWLIVLLCAVCCSAQSTTVKGSGYGFADKVKTSDFVIGFLSFVWQCVVKLNGLMIVNWLSLELFSTIDALLFFWTWSWTCWDLRVIIFSNCPWTSLHIRHLGDESMKEIWKSKEEQWVSNKHFRILDLEGFYNSIGFMRWEYDRERK